VTSWTSWFSNHVFVRLPNRNLPFVFSGETVQLCMGERENPNLRLRSRLELWSRSWHGWFLEQSFLIWNLLYNDAVLTSFLEVGTAVQRSCVVCLIQARLYQMIIRRSLLCLAHHAVRLWRSPRRWPGGVTNPVQIRWKSHVSFPLSWGRRPSLIRQNCYNEETGNMTQKVFSVWVCVFVCVCLRARGRHVTTTPGEPFWWQSTPWLSPKPRVGV